MGYEKIYKGICFKSIINSQKDYISESAELNFIKWDNNIRQNNFSKGLLLKNFKIEVDILKEYISKRFTIKLFKN